MALGGKSVGSSSTTQKGGAPRHDVPRRLAVTLGALIAAAMLGACEYADTDPVPGASSSAAVPSVPPLTGLSAEEEARQSELMANVDALINSQPGTIALGVSGGMRDGAGISTWGSMEPGTYPLRAACTGGPGMLLTIRQNGAELIKQSVECGALLDVMVDVGPGEVWAALEPVGGDGPIGGAVHFTALPEQLVAKSGVPRN